MTEREPEPSNLRMAEEQRKTVYLRRSGTFMYYLGSISASRWAASSTYLSTVVTDMEFWDAAGNDH